MNTLALRVSSLDAHVTAGEAIVKRLQLLATHTTIQFAGLKACAYIEIGFYFVNKIRREFNKGETLEAQDIAELQKLAPVLQDAVRRLTLTSEAFESLAKTHALPWVWMHFTRRVAQLRDQFEDVAESAALAASEEFQRTLDREVRDHCTRLSA